METQNIGSVKGSHQNEIGKTCFDIIRLRAHCVTDIQTFKHQLNHLMFLDTRTKGNIVVSILFSSEVTNLHPAMLDDVTEVCAEMIAKVLGI